MSYLPAMADRDGWVALGAVVAALLGLIGWASRRYPAWGGVGECAPYPGDPLEWGREDRANPMGPPEDDARS